MDAFVLSSAPEGIDAALLTPVHDNAPCGELLEYAPEFIDVQNLISGRGDEQFGELVIPAEHPDWASVEAKSIELLRYTKDIRLVITLTRAWTETYGLDGYARGVGVVAELLERYWDDVYPTMGAADDYDPLPRMNALSALADPNGLGRAVRSAIVFRSKELQLTLHDVVQLLERGSQGKGAFSEAESGRLRTEFGHQTVAALLAKDAIVAAYDTLDRIGSCLERHLDGSWPPCFDYVMGPLRVVCQVMQVDANNACAKRQDTAAGVTASQSMTRGLPHLDGHRGLGADVKSRADVSALLDHACEYLERLEPAHPAPILIRRAQRLLEMNFYEIVRDLAPDGLVQLDVYRGTTSPVAGASSPATPQAGHG